LPTRARIGLVCLAALSALLIAACGSPKKVSTQTAAASAQTCTPAKLQTHTKGTLTVATDSPAYPPYFEHNKPSNGEGFESAVAYAVAAKLGYTRSQVKWVVEPFDASYAPGPKSFDFDINEISITPAGDHRRVGFAVRPRQVAGGAQERQHRRADRDNEPLGRDRGDQAGPCAAGVQHVQ
jgi:polar amino acid transport system substrate-binding protein